MIKGQIYIPKNFGPEEVRLVEERFSAMLHEPVELEATADESLIGGFLATVDGKVYDASIASRIRDLGRFLLDKEHV